MPLDLNATAKFFSTLHVRDRDAGTRQKFTLRPQQLEIMERCKEHLARKRRLYVIFLKARRVGISTWASAIQTAHCLSKSDGHAAIIAQIRETSAELFNQASGFAKDLRPIVPDIGIGAKQLTYPHQRAESSNLRHYTAATVHGTRGLTFSSVHMTEAAFYPYEGAYTAILNTLSKDPDNICLIETTANGMEGPGEAYYEYWQAAEAGDNEFLPIFLPWYEDPEYVLNPEEAPDAPRDDYEKYLMNDLRDHRTGKSIKLGADRIAWFRDTLHSKCEGSIDKWKQEYPSSPNEAFIATGSPAFTHEELQFAESSVEPPLHRGYLIPNALGKMSFEEVRGAGEGEEMLTLWEYPQEKAHYFAGVDTARGEETNIAPGDYAAIVCWNAETGRMAARYMGRVSPEKIAKLASDIGRFYNDAALNVELNNLGYVVMRELRDRLFYPNQYRWKGRDDKFDGKPGTAFGFETTDRYRRMMFNLFRTALYRKEAIPRDKEFVRQMSATKMELGFRWNIAVGHDDVFMCFPPETPIETGDGWIPIGEICPETSVRTHSGNVRRVIAVSKRQYDGNFIGINFVGSPETIWSTPTHPFYVCRYEWNKRNGEKTRKKRRVSEPKWISSGDLRVGDSVLFPRRKNLVSTRFRQDVLKVMGWYLAEGHISKRADEVTFSFHRSERKIAEELIEILVLRDGLAATIGRGKRKNYQRKRPVIKNCGTTKGIRFTFTSKYWCDLLREHCGGGSFEKRMSFNLYGSSGLMPLVCAYFDGDGTFYSGERNHISVSSASTALIWQIHQILIDNGIWSTVSRPKGQDINMLHCSTEFSDQFIWSRKIKPVEREFEKRHVVETEDGFWAPIKAVHAKIYSGEVCNLEVEGEHTYQAAGIAVHNSGLLGWIAKEQFHPQVCNPRKPKSLILTPEELEEAHKAITGQARPEISWLTDPSTTAIGSLMMNANDHLREIARYEKKYRQVDRLAGL